MAQLDSATSFEIVAIPLVFSQADVDAARAAMRLAKRALELAKAQIACVSVETFFRDRPSVQSIDLGGDWESDDDGAQNFYMTARVHAEAPLKDRSDWAEEIQEILGDYGADLGEFELRSDGGVADLARLLMGEQDFGAWAAQRERLAIDEAAAAAPASAPALRM